MTSRDTCGPRAVVVLVSASWGAPSKPSPTILLELDRRLRREALIQTGARSADAPTPRVLSLHLEDPTAEEIEAWHITALPTWLRFEREVSREGLIAPVGASSAKTPGEDRGEPGQRRAGFHGPVLLDAVDSSRPRTPASHLSEPEPLDAGPRVDGVWVESARIFGAAPKHEVASTMYR